MSDVNNIEKAKEFAKLKHKGQLYGDKDYFDKHIVGVVDLIKKGLEFSGSIWYEQVMISAYLHDVLEDTDTAIHEINSAFGSYVGFIVATLTRHKDEVYLEYIERVGKVEMARVVKYYDVLYNLNQLVSDSVVGDLNTKLYSRYMKALVKLGRGLVDEE